MAACTRCGKALSFLQRMGGGLCPECRAEDQRAAAEAARAAEAERAAQALAARQQRAALRAKCPVCGASDNMTGRVPGGREPGMIGYTRNPVRFESEEASAELVAVACRCCGCVRLFLADE